MYTNQKLSPNLNISVFKTNYSIDNEEIPPLKNLKVPPDPRPQCFNPNCSSRGNIPCHKCMHFLCSDECLLTHMNEMHR